MPSVVVTVMIQLPFFRAVIFPFLLTLATEGLEETYFKDFIIAFAGLTEALIWKDFPFFKVFVLAFRVNEVTGLWAVTIIFFDAFIVPSAEQTEICAVPMDKAVTTPSFETEATEGLLLDQFRLISLMFCSD